MEFYDNLPNLCVCLLENVGKSFFSSKNFRSKMQTFGLKIFEQFFDSQKFRERE